MPSKTNKLLALSNSEPPQWNIVSQYSLIDCHKVNSIYFCPGNSVLRNNMKSHCLGAIYIENIIGAKSLCDLDIMPKVEQVLQLNDNKFLIYSIHKFPCTKFLTLLASNWRTPPSSPPSCFALKLSSSAMSGKTPASRNSKSMKKTLKRLKSPFQNPVTTAFTSQKSWSSNVDVFP